MKLWFGLVACALLAIASPASAMTNVGGFVVTNTTWTAANSPYIVTAAVIVGGGATLTIEPGVTVKFNAGLGITIGSQTFGAGTLKAIGGPGGGQKITFTSNTAPAAPGQWKDLYFTDFAVDAAFDQDGNYLSGSILQHCIVEYAGSGAAGTTGAVTITQSSPFINFCEVRNTSRSGIYASNSGTMPTLRLLNSNLHHNTTAPNDGVGGGGARLSVNAAILTGNTVSNNTATNSSGGGIYLNVNSGICTFTGNTVSNNTATNTNSNGGGIYLSVSSSTSTFTGNTVSSNTTGSNSNGGGVYLVLGPSATCSFTANSIMNNTTGSGGGIYLLSSESNPLFNMQSNNISGNRATNAGGGILIRRDYNSGMLANFMGNTIASNVARPTTGSGGGTGGGVYLLNNSPHSNALTVNLVSNTITRNEALGGPTGGNGVGGGIFVGENSTSYSTTVRLAGDQVSRTFNVIAGNTATVGDAVYNNMAFAENGSNDIRAEYVCWGGLDPDPTANPNLIWDFFDDASKAIVFYPPHVTDSNCVASPGCGDGLIADCNGNCAPISWIGDGICDNGSYMYEGVPIYFNCQQFGNDGGDCATPPPPLPEPGAHTPPVPPVYDPPTPPAPTQDKLILITHGWATDSDFYAAFWVPLRNAIAARVGADWKVRSYNWTADSGDPLIESLVTGRGADYAAFMGVAHGHSLGLEIGQQGYTHVHLIAHSAGSALISAAAYQIKRLSPQTVVHTTYLDAFAGTFLIGGIADWRMAYGGYSDWSDHYFSREALGLCAGTGLFTQRRLPNSFNLDVSLVDPGYDLICLSDHAWPRCFYRATVDSMPVADCSLPDGDTLGSGFPLSYEQVGGNLQTWISSRNSMYPRNGLQYLPGTTLARDERGGAEDNAVWVVRNDPAIDLGLLTSNASSPEAVVITGGAFSATTFPPGAEQGVPAWVNFEIDTTQAVNFIKFDVAFTSNPASAGLLTMYVDGIERGKVDEPYALPGVNTYAMPTPGDLAPGQHVFSFRLDPFGPLASSVIISNVSTGWGGFVPVCPGDANGDGAIAFSDITNVLENWGMSYPGGTGPGDANHDGAVSFADITKILENWGVACP